MPGAALGLLGGPILGSIPSPGSGQIHLGPLRLTAYGLMIALGVLAAVELARRRAPSRGATAEDLTVIATWAVPAGLIGARLYHVITDWRRFQGRWGDVIAIWEGGLGRTRGSHRRRAGRPGGGAGAGGSDWPTPWTSARRACRWPRPSAAGATGGTRSCSGGPPRFPGASRSIPSTARPAQLDQATFHPTFLYESLWNLALCGLLLLIDRQRRLRPGQLFWLYVAGYGLGRLWVEALRIDPASELGPFRVNTWVSLVAIVGGVVGFVVQGRRSSPGPAVGPGSAAGGGAPATPGLRRTRRGRRR